MIEYTSDLGGIAPDQLGGPFFVGWPDPRLMPASGVALRNYHRQSGDRRLRRDAESQQVWANPEERRFVLDAANYIE